jgi:hypothetical protein
MDKNVTTGSPQGGIAQRIPPIYAPPLIGERSQPVARVSYRALRSCFASRASEILIPEPRQNNPTGKSPKVCKAPLEKIF